MLRFKRIEAGALEVVADGITYRATRYQGTRRSTGCLSYWVVRDSKMLGGIDQNAPGAEPNTWYESSEKNVRASITLTVLRRRG